jgi:hypothetical protein
MRRRHDATSAAGVGTAAAPRVAPAADACAAFVIPKALFEYYR